MKHARAQILRFGASYQRQVVVKASGGASLRVSDAILAMVCVCDFVTILPHWLYLCGMLTDILLIMVAVAVVIVVVDVDVDADADADADAVVVVLLLLLWLLWLCFVIVVALYYRFATGSLRQA